MRYWTVRIGSKWFTINTAHLVWIGTVSAGLISWICVIAFSSINSNIQATKFITEKKRAHQLGLRLRDLKNKLQELNKKTASVMELDSKERLRWGIAPASHSLSQEFKYKMLSPRLLDEIEKNINEIQNKITFLTSSFTEIKEEIGKKQLTLLHTPSIWPTYGVVTSGFGPRGKSSGGGGRGDFHDGLDIANHIGTPILATADGTVTKVEYGGGLGLTIEIEHGFGYTTRYGHLHKALVKLGQPVKRGQTIGLLGSTGRSTGSHLHYEVRIFGKPVDPINYIIPGSSTY